MHLLFAAAVLQEAHNLLERTRDILEAYPTLANGHSLLTYLEQHPDPERIVMLDSGAFSAWSKGKQVPIDAYIEFCKKHGHLFTCYVNVDVIPGKWGEIPSATQVEESAAKGWANFQYMLDKGLPPEKVVHVFHQNEEFVWLQKLVDYSEAMKAKDPKSPGLYIGISPANDRTTAQKIMWLEQCMRYVTNLDGSPKLRWHGFGVTSFDIMRRYPWYTVDSTSWMRNGTYGSVQIPKDWDHYVEGYNLIAVTPDSSISQADRHFGALSSAQQARFIEYVESCGFTLEQVQNDGCARNIINLEFYKRVVKEINDDIGNNWRPLQASFI